DGARELQAFVEASGIPFYTTPISRGLIPEDHGLAFLNARSKAFTEADVVLAVGTRFNWVIQFGRPPRFAADLKVIHVDVNPGQLGHNREADVPIAGDARAVLQQLTAEAKGTIDPKRYATWTRKLRVSDAETGPHPRPHAQLPGRTGARGARRVRREAARDPAGARARVRLRQAGGGQRDHRQQGAGDDGTLLGVHDMTTPLSADVRALLDEP